MYSGSLSMPSIPLPPIPSPSTSSPAMDPAVADCLTEEARRRQLLRLTKAKLFFYIAIPPGSTTTLVVGRRKQNHGQDLRQAFTESTTIVGRTNRQVERYLDRIRAVDAAYTCPGPSTSTSTFLLLPDPNMHADFKKALALRAMRIPKRKRELEEGEIIEDPPISHVFQPQPATGSGKAGATPKTVAKGKENFSPTSPVGATLRSPTPVMVSQAISLETSRIVTMSDIIDLLGLSYSLPENIPWTTQLTDLEGYGPHLKAVRNKIAKRFAIPEVLDAEIQILKNITQIFNTTTIPHLPNHAKNALEDVEKLALSEEDLSTVRKKRKLLMKVILRLNEARVGERASVLASIEHEVATKEKDAEAKDPPTKKPRMA